MDTDTSGTTTDTLDGSLDSDFADLLDMYDRIRRGYHSVIDESIATEEMFLEFVKQQEHNRHAWYSAESESRHLRNMATNTETERGKADGIIHNIRQQLRNEMDRRSEAEERVRDLEQTLDTFRSMLGGEQRITDEDRQRLFRSADEVRRNTELNSRVWTGVRKSEDIDAHRISFDRSDDERLEEEQIEEQTTRTSTTRRVSMRNEDGELSKFIRIDDAGGGDIEIISKTHVRIPEEGPVEARASLTTRPRRSVGFTDSLSRRSCSEPRRSSHENHRTTRQDDTTFLSCDVVSDSGESVSDGSAQPVLLGRLSRRRSKSLGLGLDARPHDFHQVLSKKSESCAYCKKRINFFQTVFKCKHCRSSCHERCRGFLPVPCMPPGDSRNERAGGHCIKLETFAPLKCPRVPTAFTRLVQYIEENGSNEEGLYRVGAALEEIKKLKAGIFKSKTKDVGEIRDVHVACGLLKNLLMSLSEPLLTYAKWQQFAAAAGQSIHDEFYRLISDLPTPNRDTLAFLMLHFRKVAENPAIRMPVENLCKVVSPSVIGNSRNPAQMTDPEVCAESFKQQLIMRKLFDINRKFWTDLLWTQTASPFSSSTTTNSGNGDQHSPDTGHFRYGG